MGISFLTPMLLGGAALVAVPLVLHLAMRRKPVPHDFPALRFLLERAVANRRRLQVQHLLLLLLRIAALVLLAAALARPVLRGAGWLADAEAPVAAAFVFDTAPRMLLREANRTRLEQAATMARVLFDKLPPGSTVAVLDTGGGAAAFAPAPAAALARIDRLATATPKVSLPDAIAAGLRLLQGSDQARRELYVFTDRSHGAWDDVAPPDLAALPADTSVLYVDVSAAAPRNAGIERLELASDRVSAGTPLALTALIKGGGPETRRTVAVEIMMPDGRLARRAVKPVTVKDGETVMADFEIGGLEPGTRQGRVVIDGSDDLEADDACGFTVLVGAADRVIVAAPPPAARSGLFIGQALAPASLVKAGKARFDPQVVSFEDLETASWDDARGIVLVDPPPLAPRVWEALAEWVAAGRGLVVWLGPRASSADAFNSAAATRVLGGRLVRVWRSPGAANYLAPTALDHPLLAAFRRVGDAIPWQDFPVTRHWEFEPGAAEAAADRADAAGDVAAAPVAAYRNGLPAVLEHRVGQGTVVVVTTPVSQAAGDPDAWNTLATGFEPWPFVILANETLLHAIHTASDHNIIAGRPAVLGLERRGLAAAFVRTPGGDEFPAAIDPNRGTVTVTSTEQPGNYAVRAGGEAAGVTTGFSAALAASALDFARLDDASLAALLGPRATLARTEAELVRDVDLERVGAELFGWLILLAAVAMAGDWIVANRFYAPREVEPGSVDTAGFAAAPPPEPATGAAMPPPLPAAVDSRPPPLPEVRA